MGSQRVRHSWVTKYTACMEEHMGEFSERIAPNKNGLDCLYGGSLLCLSLASHLAWAHNWPDSGSFLVAHTSLNQDEFQCEGFWGVLQGV